MLTIRDPPDLDSIPDPAVRRLVEERFRQICNGETYDPVVHGEFLVVQREDTLESVERDTGLPIISSPFSDARYPDPSFVPVAEWIEDNGSCFEMFFLFSDDGAGTSIWVSRQSGTNPDVLAFCERYAGAVISR